MTVASTTMRGHAAEAYRNLACMQNPQAKTPKSGFSGSVNLPRALESDQWL